MIVKPKIASVFSVIIFFIFSIVINARALRLQSVGEQKNFELNLFYGDEGKGAFVQYKGQKGILELKINNYSKESANTDEPQYYFETFVWDEIVDGKINGTYTLLTENDNFREAHYLRKKDGRKFYFKHISNLKTQELYLNNTRISYDIKRSPYVSIIDEKGGATDFVLPDISDPPRERSLEINDYNLDGYDDLGFSAPDAGMGVYSVYYILVYDPESQNFQNMQEPDYSKSECQCLCNVLVDEFERKMTTSCRGGARWYLDVYKMKNGKWVFEKSEDVYE